MRGGTMEGEEETAEVNPDATDGEEEACCGGRRRGDVRRRLVPR